MEELERRVWQRVAAREEAPGEADTELLDAYRAALVES